MASTGVAICDEQRVDFRLRAQYAASGMGKQPTPPPPENIVNGSYQQIVDHYSQEESVLVGFLGMTVSKLPSLDEKVRREVVTIHGQDGNEIKLYISSPKEHTAAVPCVIHLHGGGMTILTCQTATHARWRDEMAARGLVVVGVEFRNAAGVMGPHRFPAGLHDCFTALQWVGDNRRALNITKVVLCGESGGGNLVIATTLLAKQKNKLHYIDGVYAMCPYVCGHYTPCILEALPSVKENNGLLMTESTLKTMARIYCEDPQNPLAWPYHATVEQVRGLPPHVITVNECDLLRDEGIAYYRKLQAAEVPCHCITILGTFHAADILEPIVLPESYNAAWENVKSFAYSL